MQYIILMKINLSKCTQVNVLGYLSTTRTSQSFMSWGTGATARTSRNPGPDIGGQIASNRFQARVRGR